MIPLVLYANDHVKKDIKDFETEDRLLEEKAYKKNLSLCFFKISVSFVPVGSLCHGP